MSINPFAPPESDLTTMVADQAAPPLWNPNAAACWSLLLTPAFGAYLHMRNWRDLGETAKAAESKTWMIMSIIFIVAGGVAGGIFPDSIVASSATRSAGIALLVSWYFFAAKAQVKQIREQFGTNYPRKGWVKILLIWLFGFIACTLALAAVAFAVTYAVVTAGLSGAS